MEIADWLRGLSLERYAETFRDNAIDVAVLPELSEADLAKLGVLLGHRKIMLRAIAALRGGPSGGGAEARPASFWQPGDGPRPASQGGTRRTAAAWEQNGSSRRPSGKPWEQNGSRKHERVSDVIANPSFYLVAGACNHRY